MTSESLRAARRMVHRDWIQRSQSVDESEEPEDASDSDTNEQQRCGPLAPVKDRHDDRERGVGAEEERQPRQSTGHP